MKNTVALGVLFVMISCGSSEQPKEKIYQENGVALGGYDPVSYFEQGEARLGIENAISVYDGVSYHFASTKNKNLFDENPDKYVPKYGGWCAYAIAETSSKMKPDPTMWQIQDGQLILFYDDWMTSLTGSLKDAWNEDQEAYMTKADQNWPKVEAVSN